MLLGRRYDCDSTLVEAYVMIASLLLTLNTSTEGVIYRPWESERLGRANIELIDALAVDGVTIHEIHDHRPLAEDAGRHDDLARRAWGRAGRGVACRVARH